MIGLMRCALCGLAIRWVATRWAWVHVTRGQGHAPVPISERELKRRG